MGTMAIERAVIEVHKPESMSLDVNDALAPTEGTASIKLAGRAKGATTTKPEALEP